MILFKYLAFIILFCSLSLSQIFSYKGELSANLNTSNDVPELSSPIESSWIYIPSISIGKDIDEASSIDFEYAFKIHRIFSGYDTIYSEDNSYRFWIRYVNQKSELRIGLQKIIFGPSQILRSLSWFDGYDIKNPTSQTKGVKAARYKYFINNLLSFSSWVIKNDIDPLSIGGRMNISSIFGEWGLTYYIDPLTELQQIGQTGLFIADSHNRYALDYRYDGLFGLWFESVLVQSSDRAIALGTIGMDYTLNVFNGIQILSESMIVESLDEQFYTAILMSTSIGFLHRAMIISQIDWNNDRTYNYFQWNTSFDKYSVNYTLSINPKRSSYDFDVGDRLLGYGAGHQVMFIYNY